jgi:GntR family transcriptional regulator, arabinose operon transcriptional repressor
VKTSSSDRSTPSSRRRPKPPSPAVTYDILTPAARAASTLRQEIRDGKYTIGQRMANERSLAERFGISRGTIRHALRILETERLIARQQGRGTFVADPSRAPSSGTIGTALIGALVWEKTTFFGSILQAATLQASERGYVLTTGSNISLEAESQHIKAFVRSGVRGVLLSPLWRFSGEGYRELQNNNIAVVMLDTRLLDCDEDFVSVNDREGTRIATSHLLQLGHTRIGYYGFYPNPKEIPTHRERLGGYRDACDVARLKIAPEYVIEQLEGQENPPDALRSLLKSSKRPTAFVCYNDVWAINAITTARALGMKVPGDLSVVGFDDSAVGQKYDVPLTTIHPQFREVGIAAVDLLIDKIDKEREKPTVSILVTPRLIVRSSTARPPSAD